MKPSARPRSSVNAGKAAMMPSRAPRTLTPLKPKPPVHIPPILLEGDDSSPRPSNPPALSIAPTPASASQPGPREELKLPEAYGTGRLLLTARDPLWLYVHWDLTTEQLQ